MINYIQNIFQFKQKTNTVVCSSDNKEIAELHFIFDLKTENIIPILKIYPYNFVEKEKDFLEQAESFAALLNDFCGDNNYVKNLILESIDVISKNSENDNLFMTNVLFFWKTKYHMKKQEEKKNKMPVVRPISVFRNK